MKLISRILSTSILVSFLLNLFVFGKPAVENSEPESQVSNLNNTKKDLYVIREVVYEVGILIDTNDTEESGSGSTELVDDQVQVTIFGSNNNGTLQFGDIPIPVKVNNSGEIDTGISTIHLGELANLTALSEGLPFNGTIVNITKTEQTYLVLDSNNITDSEGSINETILDRLPEISEKLPPIGQGAD
uniref:CSON004368 protein n=1 Tax=Culicoides sonorensis TaxID=179676 RepID=A0A336LT81_CULSO